MKDVRTSKPKEGRDDTSNIGAKIKQTISI